MTDAHPQANGHMPHTESARRVNQDLDDTAGYRTAAEGEVPPVPYSGEATAWPGWPGVIRPAGWFLSAAGEAAPPVRHDMEPARTDAGRHPAAEPQPDGVPDFPGPAARAPESCETAGYAPDGYEAGDCAPGGYRDGDYGQGGYDDAGYWYEDPQPTSLHQSPPPESWQWAPQGMQEGVSWGSAGRQATRQEPVPQLPIVGPTAALRGRAGGPGFVVPPGAVPGLYDPSNRSGWQLSHGVWRDSGISWTPAVATPEPAAVRSEQPGESPRGGFPAQPRPSGRGGQVVLPQRPPAAAAHPAFTPSAPAASAPGAFAGTPLGAPTMADAQAPTRPEAPPLPARSGQGDWAEPDELYRAWQGSVRQASGRPRTAGRRRHTWQVVRVGVPAAVIVTVGAGAVMMLTGKTGEMLAERSNQGNPNAGTGATAAGGAFPGYPGQHGTVTVSSMAAAGGMRLAVGSADGHPAIWRRAADGNWTLVSASSSAVYQRPGTEDLTSIAHGPAGWIATGGVLGETDQQPVLLSSADGVTWQPLGGQAQAAFATPATYVTGVTGSRNGYVVVGRQVSDGRVFATMWWSADLRDWVMGSNGGLDGRLKSSAAYAVAATAAGFVAVGSHGTSHAIWTSADGRNWTVSDVPEPAGASTAVLRMVAVNGNRVAAAGYAVTRAGEVPVVVVSADGGQHWSQIVLPAPGGVGVVTALTAAGGGFVAAGQAGPAGGAQQTVTWSSRDGLSWPAAASAGGQAGQITALSAAGGTVTGTVQHGADPSVVTIPAP
jgi:hypothetical protein